MVWLTWGKHLTYSFVEITERSLHYFIQFIATLISWSLTNHTGNQGEIQHSWSRIWRWRDDWSLTCRRTNRLGCSPPRYWGSITRKPWYPSEIYGGRGWDQENSEVFWDFGILMKENESCWVEKGWYFPCDIQQNRLYKNPFLTRLYTSPNRLRPSKHMKANRTRFQSRRTVGGCRRKLRPYSRREAGASPPSNK